MSHDPTQLRIQHQRRQHLTTALDILMHPLLAPTFATITICALFYSQQIPSSIILTICLGMFLLTAVLPLCVAALMQHYQATHCLWHATQPRDRQLLSLVYLIFFLSTHSLLRTLHLPSLFLLITAAATLTLCLLFVLGLLVPRLDAHYAAWSALSILLLLLGRGLTLNLLPAVMLITLLTGVKGALNAQKRHLDAPAFLTSMMVGMLATIIAFII